MTRTIGRRLPGDVMAFAAYQLALTLVVVVTALCHGLGPAGLSSVYRNNDASWFLSISHHGYQPNGDRPAAIAFFPLYPMLIHVATWILRNDVVAAVAVSSIASVIGHTFFYRAVRSRPELRVGASNALILLMLYPTAIYFSLVYSEGLYLLLTAGFVYFLLQDRIGVASAFAALAALTRQPGFLCVVPLGLWVLTDTTRMWPSRLRRLGWCAVVVVGYSTFLAINKVVYDEWFAFTDQLESHWGKRPAPLWQTLPDAVRFLRHPDWYLGWPVLMDNIFVLAVLVILLAWPVTCWRRFDRSRWVLLAWAGVQVGFIASSSATTASVRWMSSTRYLMLVLPLFIALGDLARQRRWIIYSLGGGSAVLAGASIHRLVTKQWIA